MKRNIVILGLNFLLLLTALDVSANAHVENKNDIHWPSYTFKVNNPLSVSRDDLVCLAQASLPFTISSKNAYVVEVSGEIVDSQVLSCFHDNDTLGLAFISPFKAHETKIAKVFISDNQNIETRLENKTYAELQVRVGGVFKKDKLKGGDYVPVNYYQLPTNIRLAISYLSMKVLVGSQKKLLIVIILTTVALLIFLVNKNLDYFSRKSV